ncbi:MAG: tetratricopeptide repeat protein [Vicinamibacterales bacterium]
MLPIALWLLLLWPITVASGQTGDAMARLGAEGSAALSAHRYADAERAYEQLRELSPKTAEVHATLGFIYFQQGKFAQAVAALKQAAALKPGLPNADLLLAMSLSELGRFADALPGLERGFAKSPDAALRRSAGLQLQRAYTGLGRHADAVGTALRLAKLYPKDPEVLYHASRLHANFAFLTLQDLAAAAPDSLWVHLAAGEANESQGLDEAAVKEYRAVLAIDPRRPGVHYRIGRVLLARSARDGGAGIDAAALEAFELELENDPTNANAAYEAAEIHRKAGDLAKARASFESALEHYPEFEDALIGLARALIGLQEPALAVTHLKKAIALNGRSEVAFYQLAQAHAALGDAPAQQQALEAFQALRAASESSAPAGAFSRTEVTKQKVDPDTPGRVR